MAVSYQATVEYTTDLANRPALTTKFFTCHRAQKDSPKKRAEADSWLSDMLRQHGTTDVRCTLARVEFCILG